MDLASLLIPIAIVVVLVILFGLFVLASRHSLVILRQRVDEAWRDLTEQRRRRADLIPVLVSSVQGYASHERTVFQAVDEARAESIAASTPEQASSAENHVQQALRSVIGVADGYPKLAASPDFLRLQSELGDTEDKVQTSRRFYNGGVREFNTKIQVFPNNILARRLGFSQRQFFEAADGTTKAAPPRIQF